MPESVIASFVVRFVLEQEQAGEKNSWHGVIRHVQSNEQIQFNGMQDALNFIQLYINLDNPALPVNSTANPDVH